MTVLDFFTIHVESDVDWIDISVEMNFVCEDHTTIIECEGLAYEANLSGLFETLKDFFESETECSWSVSQYYGSYRHKVSIFGSEKDPSFAFDCDSIKITETTG